MNSKAVACAFILLTLTGKALAEVTPPEDGNVSSSRYQYGMNLDIAEVMHLSDDTGKEGLVISTMKYRDHNGVVHTLKYKRYISPTNENG